MSNQDMINAILAKLNEDTPTTNTGIIVKAILTQGIPQQPTSILQQVCTMLGIDYTQVPL